MVLHRLLERTDSCLFRPSVIALRGGRIAPRIAALGVPVTVLGVTPAGVPRAFATLVRALRRSRPDIVQTWMYHGDLMGGLAARTAGVPAVVWGVHHAGHPDASYRRHTRAVAAVNAVVSGLVPDRVVCSSASALEAHAARGYPREKLVLIRNGVPIPPQDFGARARLRAELGLPSDAVVVGRVGRLHSKKGYEDFFAAAGMVARRHPEVHVVAVGAGLAWRNRPVAALVEGAGLTGRTHLLGLRDDAPALQASFDVAVSSSRFGETAPLVISEAMAAGVPVVTTDVGDSAALVGDTGRVVPPRSVEALASAVSDLVALGCEWRREEGEAARRRVAQHFSVDAMARSYVDLHWSLAGVG